MRRRLCDSVVVITGASSGIGRALAPELAKRGANLALAARRMERLERLNRSLDGRHLCLETDVTHAQACATLIRSTVGRFGRIDTLVCNAGFGLIKPVLQTCDRDASEMFRTNVCGTLNCVRPAAEAMLRQPVRDGCRGQIVIMSSAAARRGLPEFGAYTATKAAQLALAESLRVELRGSGIVVTTIHPVTTATEFFRTAMRLSRTRSPRRCGIETLQAAEHVAGITARAIERPRVEVWPRPSFRLLMGLAVLAPGVTDRILSWRVGRQRRLAVPPAPIAAQHLTEVAG